MGLYCYIIAKLSSLCLKTTSCGVEGIKAIFTALNLMWIIEQGNYSLLSLDFQVFTKKMKSY